MGKDVVRYDLDFEVGYYEGTTRMSFLSDEFQDRLHHVLKDGNYHFFSVDGNLHVLAIIIIQSH